MAGDIFLKEVPIYFLSTSNAAALATATLTTAVGNNLDVRNLNATTAVGVMFSLNCSWNSTSGITTGTDVADLYLLPALNGTTFSATGTSTASPNQYVASFINPSSTITVSTVTQFDTGIIELFPALYKAAIINQSGQTMNSSWTLLAAIDRGAYT